MPSASVDNTLLDLHNSSYPTKAEFKLLLYYASVNSSCAQRPPGQTPGHQHFFCLEWQIPGLGTLELSNPPGWGREKRAKAPSSVNSATFFIDRIVEQCRFKHFNVQFLVSINVFVCNSAMILIRTSCRNDMHQFIILVLM